MLIKCGWCQKDMGQKEPLENTAITSGICQPCFDRMFPKKRTKKELIVELAAGAVGVGMLFYLLSCQAVPPEHNFWVQCPDGHKYLVNLERYKDLGVCVAI